MIFATHDPPFVKKVNPKIPLIQSLEHPIIEAIELMSNIEQFSAADAGKTKPLATHGYWGEQEVQPVAERVPEFVILDPLEPLCMQALQKDYLPQFYTVEKQFYYGVSSWRYLYKRS